MTEQNQAELDALRKRAIEAGLRMDDDAPPPTEEELAQYVAEVEQKLMTEEEQELALQAQADLAKGERLARERSLDTIKAQKKEWKGINNRTHFISWAKQALRRAQIESERQQEEALVEQERNENG
jgi:hypothetical protein